MRQADLVVATGSPNNVRAAYSSGRPAMGVGVGNVVVIVDESADLDEAARKIAVSKTFDNATSCSSENALVVVEAVYESFVAALAVEGGMLLDEQQARRLEETHWHEGKIQKTLLAKDIDVVLERLGLLEAAPQGTRFLVAPLEGVGRDYPLSGEKMARFLALYRVSDFESASDLARQILAYQGAGHSVGLHSRLEARALELALRLPACRVIVNQAHCFATGGSFDNALPFSLTMGCGSWGGNSIDDNLNWRHFVNRVRIVRPIPRREPSLESLFQDYWREAGT